MEIEPEQIVEYVGETFAERGETYFEEGRIVSPRIDGDRLFAECYGSREKPYRVEIRTENGEIAGSKCTCPVTGPCKHVAALLYTWVHERDRIADPGRVRDAVEEMPRRELVEIVLDIAGRFREAERYLERRLLERDESGDVDPEEIRRHAARGFQAGFERASGHGFGEVVASIVDDLERLAAVGARHYEAGRETEALAVWKPLVEVAAEHDLEAGRGLDDLFEFLGELEEALIDLLEHLDEAGARERVFDALWQLFELDLDHGGVGLARPFWGALRASGTEREEQKLADRARERYREERSAGWPDERTGRLLIRFLEEFDDEGLDLETRLRDYDSLGASEDLVETLVEAGRRDEAEEHVRTIEYSREFVGALERLVDEGMEETAENLARERLDERGHDHTVQVWLVGFLVERDCDDEALEVALAMLEQHPNREDFDRVELLASALDRWEDVRERALEILREDAPRAFLQYVLDEGEVDDVAVEVWEREFAPRSHERWRASDLELELADRLEATHPEVAIRIWREEIDALIEAGSSDDYRRAAELLARIEELLERRDDSQRWRSIRDDLLDADGGGGAWRDALDEAGLLS